MDDFQVEDPRRHSAKKINLKYKNRSRRRTFGQYLFDLLIKTLILFLILALDFTLFANAGNYNLFVSSIEPMPEAFYIYLGIGIFSVAVMFISSLIRPLENIVLSAVIALFCIAIINQFATFDKKSGLLILFKGLFTDEINFSLYEYSFLIIGVGVFVITWILLRLFSRSFLFYFFLLLLAVLGWTLSEAYLNSSVKYYRVVASSPALRSETIGKNLVFLSFRNLTTPNNLKKMAKDFKDSEVLESSAKNALGFYMNNDFLLYPNALQQSANDPFINLVASYNPDSKDNVASFIQTTAVRDGYFNFEALQNEKKFMKQNSLYDTLRKGGYSITVYQSSDLDTCYVGDKLAVSVCKEKVSVPMTMSSEYFSVIEKTWLLVSQWLISTGFVPSLDPVLKVVEYVQSFPDLKPLSFKADNVSVVNSYKALEQIAESLDSQNGNQAYFAIIDLPSETYVYDEFCQMQPMAEWGSEKDEQNRTPLDVRRRAYAKQVSCLYGSLEKFMQQLDNSGMLENTTIIIEGLSNPLNLNKIDNDYYGQMQDKIQVPLAVRRPDSRGYQIDYKVCTVSQILQSIFFTHKPCREFEGMVMADKLATEVKKQVEDQKYSSEFLRTAKDHFVNWFNAWGLKNQFGKSLDEKKLPKTVHQNILDTEEETVDFLRREPVDEVGSRDVLNPGKDIQNDELERVKNEVQPTQPVVEVQDAAERKNNISMGESISEDVGEEVVPDTLYDAVRVIQQTEAEAAIDKAKRSLEEKKRVEFEKKQMQIESARAEIKATAQQEAVQVRAAANQVYQNVLEAPVSQGEKLSPEELKEQYHRALRQAGYTN